MNYAKLLLAPFFSYKYLLYQLIQREIKARYKQSAIGMAWILVNPFAQLLVYNFVFTFVIQFRTGEIPYALFLFAGLLPWTFLQTAITNSTYSLVDNAALLRKVQFPREVIPYSIVTAKALDLFFASSILAMLFVWYWQPISWTALLIIPLFILQFLLVIGMSLILSSFNLFYRDVQYLTNLLLMVWMYMTPVLYPYEMLPGKWKTVLLFNPMVGIIEGYRAALFQTPFHSLSIVFSIVISLTIFFGGWLIFKKTERWFADVV